MSFLKKRIQAMESFDWGKEKLEIVESNKDVLADLLAEQLAKGINGRNERINPEYTPFTIANKKEFGKGLGRVTDRVTFFFTGELYSKLRAQIQSTRFGFTADTFKFDRMVKRSGNAVVQLNDDSCERFALDIVRPQILERYKKQVVDKS